MDAAPADVAPADVAVGDARDVPPPPPAPVLVGVVPDHGSFLGGTEVTLRGNNFPEDVVVRFGDAMVQPRYTRWVDSHRVVVATPAGRPGDVNVTVESGGRTATMPNAYHYDSFYVDPGLGPTTGNARVSLHGSGTRFMDGMTVAFDGMPCRDVVVTSNELASCLTPEHPEGRVEVTLVTGGELFRVRDGYQYTDNNDSVGGGLAGGPVRGSLTVTVLNAQNRDPVPQAFVFLDNDPRSIPPRAGRTNARGQVTLSPPGLMPPVTVTASKNCFTTTTVQAFNASTATVYLTPLMIPGCGEGMPMGMAQRPVYPATLTGELVWEGSSEFSPNPWNNIPRPRPGERRIARVFTTRPDIYTVDPMNFEMSGQTVTVQEVIAPGYGGRGYPFRLIARPTALAVYALAGIENTTTMRFTPYLMGVARAVLGAPRATVSNIVVNMNIPLDHELGMEVRELPAQVSGQPNRVVGAVFIDLGGEGVIPRPELTVTGRSDMDPYRFSGLPAFTANLADARLTVHARYVSGDPTGPRPFDAPAPLSGVILQGITNPDETVVARNWLGIPDGTAPMPGEALPTDRNVRFNIAGPSPDLLIMTLQWGGGAWQHYAPGAERVIRYPDLSTVMGLSDLPSGALLQLSLVGVRIPGFAFDRFTYSTIGTPYWTAYAGRGTFIRR
jgi:hypothetical protein